MIRAFLARRRFERLRRRAPRVAVYIMINGIGGTVPACLIPPLAFLLVALTVFAGPLYEYATAAAESLRDGSIVAIVLPEGLR